MKIEKIYPWDAEAEEGLSECFRGDREAIVRGVDGRSLECYRLWDGQAYMVTRVEEGELTCVCYQGARLVEACAWIQAECQRRGLRSMRFHTTRPALQRLLRQFNFRHDEHVFRCEVA